MRFFLDRLDAGDNDLRKLRAKICAIGPATRAAIEALHLKVDLMGKEYVAEGLLEAFAAHRSGGQARSAAARRRGPRPGARRTRPPRRARGRRRGLSHRAAGALARNRCAKILAHRPDCLTFTSSSTVRNLVEAAGADALRGIAVASIGPITTQTARELGIEVAAQAKVFTVEGLVDAVLGLYTEMTPPSED